MTESEQVIRKLYRITNEYSKGFKHQVTRLLEMGCQRFGLEIGILSKIDGERYEVLYHVAPEEVPLADGALFSLPATYCAETVKAHGPVGFEHMAKDRRMQIHPAYKALGLEAYIGVPVEVGGRLFGTLNFSSPFPRERKFSPIDTDALQLMASWIASELERREQEKRIAAQSTELARANEELEELNRNLARRVEEEVANQRAKEQLLIRQSRMAEMGEMVAVIAHQWKQPVAAIAYMAEDMEDTFMEGEADEEYVTGLHDRILENTDFLVRTIDDFRNFFKKERNPERFDLKEAARAAAAMLDPQVKKAGASLSIDGEPIFINGYSREIQQVVLVLVNNALDALKARREGNRSITVTLSGDQGKARLTVEDNGGGIAPEHLGKLFTQDFSTKGEEGTGIGLWMAKTIVERNHGVIAAENAVSRENGEKGARFTLTFPLD